MNLTRRGTDKRRETVGGYPAGDKLASELKPPPPNLVRPAKAQPAQAKK